MPVTRINPPELFDSEPVGFSQMVVVGGDRPSIHLSGQVAWNASREIVGEGDLYRQVVQSLRNIEIALGHADAGLHNVVALRIYIRQNVIHDSKAVTRGLTEVFGSNLPCATWIGVPCLAREEFLVEIEPTVDMSIEAD
ncbi:MAG: RidA family protein [Alphaproteobacteria bacterium]